MADVTADTLDGVVVALAGLSDEVDRGRAIRFDVVVLVVPNCPHQAGAERQMREVLDNAGSRGRRDAEHVYRDRGPDKQLCAWRVSVVRVNGVDPFPVAPPPSLACRLYRTDAGIVGFLDRVGLTEAMQRDRWRPRCIDSQPRASGNAVHLGMSLVPGHDRQ